MGAEIIFSWIVVKELYYNCIITNYNNCLICNITVNIFILILITEIGLYTEITLLIFACFQEIRRKAQAQQQFVEDFVHALEESSKTASQIQNEVENVAFAKDSARMMSKTHKETVFSAKAGETPTTTRVVDEHYFYKHPLLDKLADKSSQEGAQVVSKLEEEVVPAAAKREDYEQYIASDTIMRDVLIEKAVYQHMLNNLHILPVSDRQYIVDKMQEVGLDAPLVKGLLQKEITVAYDESQSWTLRIVDPIAIERLAKCQAFANIPGMESKIAESLEKEASVCALLILKNFNEVPKEQKVMALGQIAVCAEKDTEVQTKLNEFMSQKVWTALEASYPEPGDKLKYLDLVRAGDIADVDLKSLDPEIKEFALSVEGQSIFKDMALKAGEDIIAHLDELPREAQVKVIEQKLRPAFKSIGIKFSKLPDITAIQETHVVVRDQAGEALDKARIAAVNIVVDTGAASLVQSSGNTRPAQNGPLQPKKPGAIIEL